MKKLLDNVTDNTEGSVVRIDDGRTYAVGIAADAAFGGGTLTLKVLDLATGTELAAGGDNYTFTDVFEPFEITLAPGMGLQMTLTGATAPDISGVFLYKSED